MLEIFLIILVIIIFYVSKSKSSMKDENLYDVAYELGVKWLKIIKNPNLNQAVMFDIDDTLINVSNGKNIQPIVNLLNYCIKHNFIVIIVTARDVSGTAYTINQLKEHNLKYTRLYLRRPDQDLSFKSKLKEDLTKNSGLTFVMSVGDNWYDVSGQYSGYGLKLPDLNDHRLGYIDPNTLVWKYII
jgi:predicted secreted acid phosphatase